MGSISRHPAIAIIAAATVAACSDAATTATTASPTIGVGPVRPELGTIQHIVIIMQENRSFDHYFGTFPGADGIPMSAGVPTVCVNDPASGLCVKPFHDANDKNHGGPHGQTNAAADIGGGKMNGFIGEAEKAQKGCADPNDPACAGAGSPSLACGQPTAPCCRHPAIPAARAARVSPVISLASE